MLRILYYIIYKKRQIIHIKYKVEPKYLRKDICHE